MKKRIVCCGCNVTAFYSFRCRWCGHDYSKLIDPFTEELTPVVPTGTIGV